MPSMEVSDAAYALVTGYAQLWAQTEPDVVDTLIRLSDLPVHTVAAPPATTMKPDGAHAGEAQR